MIKLKKVNYIIVEIYYWDCPNCEFPNETNSLRAFGECANCKTKYMWGKKK